MSDTSLTPEEIKKNIELLRQKIKNQSNLLREKKQNEKNKKTISQSSIENHPMYKTLKNIDQSILNNSDSMNKMIETMASKFTNDSKQKKLYKRKVKDLLDKIKTDNKDEPKNIESSNNTEELIISKIEENKE
jgi:uncharacterized membrane-anchored protein YjiN (DUF445 family)